VNGWSLHVGLGEDAGFLQALPFTTVAVTASWRSGVFRAKLRGTETSCLFGLEQPPQLPFLQSCLGAGLGPFPLPPSSRVPGVSATHRAQRLTSTRVSLLYLEFCHLAASRETQKSSALVGLTVGHYSVWTLAPLSLFPVINFQHRSQKFFFLT
jgi:hypothetical protein